MKRICRIIALALVALLCFVGYAEETTNASAQESVSVSAYLPMEKGAKGDEVKALQKRLNELGYKLGKADGNFGKNTYNAVCDFQRDYNLEATGIVDEGLYELIFSDNARKKDNTKLVDGWYVADDGKVAIKPIGLTKSNNGYSLIIQTRLGSKKSGYSELSINADNDTLLSLLENKTIQNFVCEGNGQYSFNVVCDAASVSLPNLTGITMIAGFTLNIS